MAEASIPVDLLNPGQVFACFGFAETAGMLLGDAEVCFDWSSCHDVRFRLRAGGDVNPFERVLLFLCEADAVAEAPHRSPNVQRWIAAWGAPPAELPVAAPYASPDPPSPATLVCVIRDDQHEMRIDHWADATRRDNVKFWAGAGGYPGAALARDALGLLRDVASSEAGDPFAVSAPQSSSFRLDWRRDYIPLDAGFSLNAHDDIATVGFPVVEMLAAIGLAHARPRRLRKLEYSYAVIGVGTGALMWLPLSLLRACLGGLEMPFETRRFRMFLGWPGKEGQARAITNVIEETQA